MVPQIFSLLFTIIVVFLFQIQPISPLDFTFNGFNSSSLLIYDNATIRSSILTLTDDTTFSMGLALYKNPVITKPLNSSLLLPFSTSFIFSISSYPNRLPGHGFAFIFTPSTGINDTSSAQHLGLLNFTTDGNASNHVFSIEFDLFKNQEFNDTNYNHVGLNVNSLSSLIYHGAGYWVGDDDKAEFREVKLNNGDNYQVWVDYLDSQINVTMARAGMRRPNRSLINASVDLDSVFLDEMHIGFCAATGQLVESHRILSWGFSNSNFSIGDGLITKNLPSFVSTKGLRFRFKWFVAGVSVGVVCAIGCGIMIYVVLVQWKRRQKGVEEELADWELEYWPHRMHYQEIYDATNGFSEGNVIGYGGNGKVYRGVLRGGVEVAVKHISHGSEHGMKEFLAEVSTLGRLKHKNLVGFRGWCKGDKSSLTLIYDYMENGSLDKRLFECEERMVLNWEERVKVLKDVTCGVFYLHDGWENRVLHRDIKANNVLLDKDMTAKLGDFGLAQMQTLGDLTGTTRLFGTVGYMPPEVVRTGRASAQTDVFSFGVLVLEVVCGRRAIEEGKPGLTDWVCGLMERGSLGSALDESLKDKGGYTEEVVEKILHLGLLCVNPDPNCRPKMRDILKMLEGTSEGNQHEGEVVELNVLDGVNSAAMWSNYRWNNAGVGFPTYHDIQECFSSLSLGESDILRDGR